MKSIDQLYIDFTKAGGRFAYTPPLSRWNQTTLAQNPYNDQSDIDLYIHLPFCPKLCTFCGCNITITQDQNLMKSYLEALKSEWKLKRPDNTTIHSLTLGGGTPNFVEAKELANTIKTILNDQNIKLADDFYFRLEADPRIDCTDTIEEILSQNIPGLKSESDLFIQFGVQDLDSRVTHNVNREQSPEKIHRAIEKVKTNFKQAEVYCDMIYGLSFQRPESMNKSMHMMLEMPLDGISFYPLAKVPWQKKNQQLYGEIENLSNKAKKDLFLCGREILIKHNFFNLGLGHFVSRKSKLFEAFNKKTLTRTLMGYGPSKQQTLLGLGVSSIGYGPTFLTQNTQILKNYLFKVNQSNIPIERTHQKNSDDKNLDLVFHSLSTESSTDLSVLNFSKENYQQLKSLISEHLHHKLFLLDQDHQQVHISEQGRDFLKVLCQAIFTIKREDQ